MISTKYYPPMLNKNIINRNRLMEKFQRVTEAKLTCVVAPAGYGKTTSVLHWLKNCGMPFAWLSLDAHDKDPMVFWRYLCAALNNIKDGISKEEESALSSQELIHSNIHIDILIDCLSDIETDMILVLDDLHMIENTFILESLSYFIKYLPEKMHLIIISRTAPEFGLARHKIKWQTIWLEERDLRFNKEEITRFYEVRGYYLPDNDVEKVEQSTEGWVVALVAIAMSMENTSGSSGAIAALARSSKDVEQYLKDEVISTWRHEKKVFAMKTCILDTLSEDICDALTGDRNGKNMLREISEHSGFLIAVNDEKNEFRYHHLFKDFLNKLLLESFPRDISELHIKAADWYCTQENWAKAIDHYINGRQFEQAVDLIEKMTHVYVNKNDFVSLLSWIERLPFEYRQNNFRMALINTAYFMYTNQLDLAWEWITKMEETAIKDAHASDPQFIGYAGAVNRLTKLKLLVLEGKIEEAFAQAKILSEHNEDKHFISAGYVDLNVADIYFYRCPIHRIVELYKTGTSHYSEFISNYRRMIAKNPGYAPLATGEYLYENNKLEEALPYLLEALEEAKTVGCLGALVPVMVNLARIKRAKGDTKGALQVVDECVKILNDIGKSHWNYSLEAFRCRMNIDNNGAEKADDWFRCCKFDVFYPITKTREFELIVFARMLIAKGRTDDAKLLLHRLLRFVEDAKRRHSEVEILNLFAAMACKAEEMSDAFGYLERSLVIGLEDGLVRSFIDESEPFSSLLRQYIRYKGSKKDDQESKELSAFAKTLLQQFRENGISVLTESDTRSDGLITLLTDQERKVLRLVMDAFTNKEIGTKLGVSLPTVKYYTGSIYGKLGVKNRAQCIKLAHEAHFFE